MLYQYVDGKPKPLSKPFKTREAAEKARLKYPEREQRKIGIGVTRSQERLR